MSDWNNERDWYNGRIVESVLSWEVVDKDNQKLLIGGISPHMPWFTKYGVIHYGNTPQGHTPRVIGEPLAWKVDGNKLLIKWGVHDRYPFQNDAWREIQAYGTEGCVSLGGQPLSEPKKVCSGGSCHEEIDETGVWEASFVGTHPANPGAKNLFVSLAKSEHLIEKPFGTWENWDDCMAEMTQRYDKDTAKKVCGKLKAKLEKEGMEGIFSLLVSEFAKSIMEWNMSEEKDKVDEKSTTEEENPKKKIVEEQENEAQGSVSLEDIVATLKALVDRVAALEDQASSEPEEEEEEIVEEAKDMDTAAKKLSVEFKSAVDGIRKEVASSVEKALSEFKRSLVDGETSRPEGRDQETPFEKRQPQTLSMGDAMEKMRDVSSWNKLSEVI